MQSGDVFSRGHDGSLFEFDGSLTTDLFDDMLKWSGDKKASDIRIMTNSKIKADIGGTITEITRRPVGQPEIDGIIRYVYGEHGPGFMKAGYDIDPSHEVRMPGIGIKRYRVNATTIRIPGGDGVQITIRTLPTSPVPLEQLQIEPEILENIRPKDGTILVTGPTGSGKSTLLSSIVGHLLTRPNSNEAILEYSSPIEYVYDDLIMPNSIIAQTEVGRHLRPVDGGDGSNISLYAYATRNALRRKPTIVVLGEMRDREAIQGGVELAITGHLVYSTTHVIGVVETIRRLVNAFDGNERNSMAIDILQTTRMIVTQLLFPRKGGGRVACREYAIFDDRTRGQFLGKPIVEWPAFTRRLMQEKRIPSLRMSEAVWNAYVRGDIDSITYKQIVSAERDRA